MCKVTQSCLTYCDCLDCSPPGSSVHGISRQEYWSRSPFPPPRGLPDPGIEPMSPRSPVSPAVQANSFPAVPLGKQNIAQYYFMPFSLKMLQFWPLGIFYVCACILWQTPSIVELLFSFSHFLAQKEKLRFCLISLLIPFLQGVCFPILENDIRNQNLAVFVATGGVGMGCLLLLGPPSLQNKEICVYL